MRSVQAISRATQMLLEGTPRTCMLQAIGNIITELLSKPMGVRLNLTGWFTSERQWHEDDC